MTSIVRKNLIVFTAAFAAADGSNDQPTNAEVVVTYKNRSGSVSTYAVEMTQPQPGSWSASWDTSNAAPGEIDYTVRCWGGVVGAMDGKLTIKANKSNETIA